MAEKHTDEKLYRVVCKDGSHLNTKVNPDGTKSALQFTDDNNDLSGPVDLLEIDEEELIRTEYISVPQEGRYYFNEDAKETMREKINRMLVIEVNQPEI